MFEPDLFWIGRRNLALSKNRVKALLESRATATFTGSGVNFTYPDGTVFYALVRSGFTNGRSIRGLVVQWVNDYNGAVIRQGQSAAKATSANPRQAEAAELAAANEREALRLHNAAILAAESERAQMIRMSAITAPPQLGLQEPTSTPPVVTTKSEELVSAAGTLEADHHARSTPAPSRSQSVVIDELSKIAGLKEQGILPDAQFETMRTRLLTELALLEQRAAEEEEQRKQAAAEDEAWKEREAAETALLERRAAEEEERREREAAERQAREAVEAERLEAERLGAERREQECQEKAAAEERAKQEELAAAELARQQDQATKALAKKQRKERFAQVGAKASEAFKWVSTSTPVSGDGQPHPPEYWKAKWQEEKQARKTAKAGRSQQSTEQRPPTGELLPPPTPDA